MLHRYTCKKKKRHEHARTYTHTHIYTYTRHIGKDRFPYNCVSGAVVENSRQCYSLRPDFRMRMACRFYISDGGYDLPFLFPLPFQMAPNKFDFLII